MPPVGSPAQPVTLYDVDGNPLLWSGGALPVTDTSATLYVGTLATSITAAPIAASQAVREVAVQNDPDNTADMLIGNSIAQTIQLKPGDTLIIPVANLATVYAKSVRGTPTLNYLGWS